MGRIEILAHRGWWDRPEERNTLGALARAFAAGMGVETDLRDRAGEIVISHDPPAAGNCQTFRELLELYARAGQPGQLALNIKSDGLQSTVKSLLLQFDVKQYFLFDMSIPDALQWLKSDCRIFTRQSEYEPVPALYDRSAGIWIDSFRQDWFESDLINFHLNSGKQVAIVSPEIHGRDPKAIWALLSSLTGAGISLCTDRIADARRFFHGQD